MDPKVIAAVTMMFMNQGINHALAACEGFKVMINSLNHALEETSRSFCAHERKGVFWEKDVPTMSNGVFKSVFRTERSAFDMLVHPITKASYNRCISNGFCLGMFCDCLDVWSVIDQCLRNSEGVLPPGVAEFGTHLYRTKFSNSGESGRSALANYFCAQELE